MHCLVTANQPQGQRSFFIQTIYSPQLQNRQMNSCREQLERIKGSGKPVVKALRINSNERKG